MRRGFQAAAAALAVCLAVVARGDEAAAVRDAVAHLYGALAAGDTAALAAFLPAEGFTEFSPPEHTLKVLDLAFFRRALDAGAHIDLHVVDPKVHILGDSAVLTGFRAGTLTLPDGRRLELHDCLTMVWKHEQAAWQLRHVHVSECPA